MCLYRVDEKPKVKEGVGWKIFKSGNGVLFPQFMNKPMFKEEVWVKDKKECKVYCRFLPHRVYPSGFHLFKTREEARKWNISGNPIRKIKFRNVVATGIQDGFRVIVAREIYITKDKV